jgi:hypothetical protein
MGVIQTPIFLMLFDLEGLGAGARHRLQMIEEDFLYFSISQKRTFLKSPFLIDFSPI